jgi:hypothetical protein
MSEEEIKKKDEENKRKEKGLKIQLIAIIWAIALITYIFGLPILSSLQAWQGAAISILLTALVWFFEF